MGISQRLATSSLVNKSRIVGREADKQKLVDLLLSNDTSEGEVCRNGDKVFIIPVSGMGGIGKTTIAQLVYNEERVIQQFELKAWFEEGAEREKVLIVLDNVWNENYNNWDDLMVPLRAGAQGSKVIVTTRSEAVSLMVGSIPSYNLDGLTYEDCWSLMALHAFAGKSSSAYANLEAIGKEIVKKCGGLPLVAKALGGLLRNKVLDSEWEDILNSEIWNLLDEKNDILPIPEIELLSPSSTFKTIRKQKKQIEDIGREYFDELFSRLNDASDIKSLCRISEKVRHASYIRSPYDGMTKFEAFYEAKSLRTFLPLDVQQRPRIDENVLDELRPHWNIKELTIKSYDGARFPSWMGDPLLSNLARLELIGCTKCESLPSLGLLPSLRNLVIDGMHGVKRMGHEFYGDGCSLQPFQSLETLMLDNMLELEEWSSGVEESGVREFPRLHELTIWNCPNLRRLSPRFPALTNLEIRYCEKLDSLKRLPSVGNSVDGGELPCLHQLSILGCPKLRRITLLLSSLLRLEIYKCSELSSLPRLPLLCELDLEECDGTILRSVVDLMSLTSLHISGISNLVCLPEGMFKNLASLEELKIVDCSELMAFPREVESLLRASRSHISRVFDNRGVSKSHVPCKMGLPAVLKRLVIRKCGNLKALPAMILHTLSLEHLEISGCSSLKSLSKQWLRAACQLSFPGMTQHYHHKSKNDVYSSMWKTWWPCPTRCTSFPIPSTFEDNRLPQDCVPSRRGYAHEPEDVNHSGLIVVLSRMAAASTLSSLGIKKLTNLNSLSERLRNLKSLESFVVEECHRLKSLPEEGLPHFLSRLVIRNCPLLKRQCQMEIGRHWHKIAHISYIEIDNRVIH
ncbi:putative disease resistance protein RGA1 [Vitis vinifera]|uniref:Putative disease resistance protein RGA1 n=1 Tax=Vitis vinifera TaxID=29760 RepID=A0A438F2L6_VITVI|nr:putative disease resistance protein RGA1 [Vitis vinifera]